MYLKDCMITNVVTVEPDLPLMEALKIMQERGIRRLPVVERGRLVGLLTEGRVREASLFFTSWKFYSSLLRMRVRDVMETKLITFSPDIPVEDCLARALESKIGTILVVENGRLVGILTVTDLNNFLGQILGLGKPGIRLHLINCPRGERTRKALEIVMSFKAGIQTLFNYTPPGTRSEDAVIRIDPLPQIEELLEALKKEGFEVKVA